MQPPLPATLLITEAPQILVVDDDELVRRLLDRIFSRMGVPYALYESGDEALRMLALHVDQVQVLVTDVKMRGMSGVELAVRARDINPELSVVLISGMELEDVPLSLDARLHFLRKPFTPQEITALVRQLVS